MAEFELDKLFGLALTDARFFRQLREQPCQAIVQFDLTDSETQAVLSIAPFVTTIQQLALELDAWMTGRGADAAPLPVTEPARVVDSLLHRPTLSDHTGLDRLRRERQHTYHPEAVQVESRQDEQTLCLRLSASISRS